MIPLVRKLISGSRWEGECRVWVRARSKEGYGQTNNNRKSFLTHRLAWELLKGPIPDGLHVLHHCDNPPCWRLKHLFLGTALDNYRDSLKKGRQNRYRPQGSKNSNAKLNDERILEVRKLYATGKITQTALGEQFGVRKETIWKILRRKLWAHVEERASP